MWTPSEQNRFKQSEDENARLRQLLVQAGVDSQAQDVAASLQTALVRELHHRVKNTLAVISAITSESLHSANSLEEASKSISDRLRALGLAHDLLLQERWTGAGLRSLVEAAIKAFQTKNADRFQIEGENIAISSGPAIALSMVLHELCTNAIKHGSLSVPAGRVRIGWAADTGTQRFRLVWTEAKGPAVAQPTRRSFGTRLIEQALPGQLNSKARLKFKPAGIVCEVNIPLVSLTAK